MSNYAVYQRKLKTFRSRMNSTVSVTSQGLEQNPMYPDDTTKQIPTGEDVVLPFKIRLVRSKSVEENYIEDSAGFMPETFKWVLTLDKIQEGSSFTYHELFYTVGKYEPLIYQDKIYGYRSPVDVRSN